MELTVGTSTSSGATFLDAKTVPTPGTGGSWKRRSLELQLAAEGSVQPVAMSGLLNPSAAEGPRQNGWSGSVALMITAAGLWVVRPFDDFAGTLGASVGAVTIVVMFVRRMLFRGHPSNDGGRR